HPSISFNPCDEWIEDRMYEVDKAERAVTPVNTIGGVAATRVRDFTKKVQTKFHHPKGDGKFRGREKGNKRARIGNLEILQQK
ncbi:hypothetical protein HAX54_014591, partial [Datura stramonium]|nr:hypothetical protein [Datura stramonium]